MAVPFAKARMNHAHQGARGNGASTAVKGRIWAKPSLLTAVAPEEEDDCRLFMFLLGDGTDLHEVNLAGWCPVHVLAGSSGPLFSFALNSGLLLDAPPMKFSGCVVCEHGYYSAVCKMFQLLGSE